MLVYATIDGEKVKIPHLDNGTVGSVASLFQIIVKTMVFPRISYLRGARTKQLTRCQTL